MCAHQYLYVSKCVYVCLYVSICVYMCLCVNVFVSQAHILKSTEKYAQSSTRVHTHTSVCAPYLCL
jgi:hypothetical protein